MDPDQVPAEDRVGSLESPADALQVDAEEPPPVPFYERPVWRRAFVVAVVVAVWLLIGLVFTPAYFRF